MKTYRVLINGRNFLLELGDELTKHGFYTNRFVETSDPEQAELNAVDSVQQRNDLKPLRK